jgi:anaerobic magnesium-protoporphyrin IX monomethyl ester cyclase
MSKKILFITPPYHCGVVEVAGRWVPLTFVYLAGAAREAGFDPLIYDAMTKGHGFRQIRRRIAEVKPDYVASTAITSTAPDALEILKIAKEVNPAVKTVLGGVHPSFLYREVLQNPFVDYVVREEGEETLKELLLALDDGRHPGEVRGIAYRDGGKVVATRPRPFIRDLDSLATAWDLLDWSDYRYFVMPKSRLGAISTSRGCSHDCTFCSQQKFWHQSWRARKPEKVVEEIEHLFRTYGVNVFLIPDEYPTSSRERWERLMDLLIERDLGISLLMETRAEDIVRDRDILWKYRKAGVVHIYIGVEATDQETLDLIKKDIKVETGVEAIRLIHEHGMITETSFILGFPHETKQSIKKTLRLSKIYNPDFAHYLALAPWPYADMYQALEPYIVERDYRKYNLVDPVIKPEKMSIKEIDWAIIDCYRSFYMGKLGEMVTMKDEFKKRYLIASMKLIMNSSFIVDKLGSLGTIPPQVEALINKLRTEDVPKAASRRLTSRILKSMKINAPVSRVFAFVTSPRNWTEFVTSLVDIRNLSGEATARGLTFEWTYRMLGINFEGRGEVSEYERDRKFAMRMRGAFPIHETYLFEGNSKTTTLTIEVDYEVPGKVLGVIANRLVVEKVNMREAEAVLRKVKTICEAHNI